MHLKALAALTAFSVLAACATAAPEPTPPPTAVLPAAPTPIADTAVKAPSGEYAADPAHTSVIWRVNHLGLSMYTARFADVAAKLDFKADAPSTSTLAATIKAASVDTGLASFNGKVAKEFLGAAANPLITFVSTAVERTGESTGKVTGDLTLNGVTKPVSFDVTYYGAKFIPITKPSNRIGFSARAKINRTDWDLTGGRPFIGDDVDIIIETEFTKS